MEENRRAKGLSQAELGRRLDLPQSYISKIETGDRVPRFDLFLEIIRILGSDVFLVPAEKAPLVRSILRDPDLLTEDEPSE